MNEQIIQMVLTCIVVGLSAGWLAETTLHRRGYGLLVDMGLGVVASILGASALMAIAGRAVGTLAVSGIALGLATSAILVQRFALPWEPGAPAHLPEPGRTSHAAAQGTPAVPAGSHAGTGARTPARALARVATTGIYLVRGVPIDIQRAARSRAARDGTTLRQVLLNGLGEYAAGTWTPRAARRPRPGGPLADPAAVDVSTGSIPDGTFSKSQAPAPLRFGP